MEDVHDLGPSKVVAGDMDYDNLIYGYHSYSSRIENDPCVLHTNITQWRIINSIPILSKITLLTDCKKKRISILKTE